MKGVFLLLFIAIGLASDIYISDGVINSTSCLQMIDASKSMANETFSISTSGSTWHPWDSLIYKVFGEEIQRYLSKYTTIPRIESDTGYIMSVRKTTSEPISESFSPHSNYIITGILLLNADVGGGSVYFPRQKQHIAPECGRLILFPNSYTHPVAMDPVKIGEMRFIVTWFKN